jgi:hypothetical protein
MLAAAAAAAAVNLTMNTYTMLAVLDQVAAVEALPAVPEFVARPKLQAAG